MTQATLEALTVTVDTLEAARRLGLSAGTLRNWRVTGTGPLHIRVGGRVRYRLADLAAYLDGQTRQSTSDPGSHA